MRSVNLVTSTRRKFHPAVHRLIVVVDLFPPSLSRIVSCVLLSCCCIKRNAVTRRLFAYFIVRRFCQFPASLNKQRKLTLKLKYLVKEKLRYYTRIEYVTAGHAWAYWLLWLTLSIIGMSVSRVRASIICYKVLILSHVSVQLCTSDFSSSLYCAAAIIT